MQVKTCAPFEAAFHHISTIFQMINEYKSLVIPPVLQIRLLIIPAEVIAYSHEQDLSRTDRQGTIESANYCKNDCDIISRIPDK